MIIQEDYVCVATECPQPLQLYVCSLQYAVCMQYVCSVHSKKRENYFKYQ